MFISIGILPSMGESIGALRNTGEYLEQLTRLDPNRRYMLFDNDRVKGSIAQINDTINRDVVQALKVIRGDYSLSTQYGMIDENDTRKLIMAPGMIFIDKIENLYEEILPVGGSVEDVLLSHIHQDNHMVKPDRNKVVKYLGFISNLDVSMHNYFNDHLPKVREAFGEPDEDFAHFAVNEDGHESNMLAVIMTGMTHPMNKINEINKRIDVLEKEIAAKNEARKRVTGLEELNSRMSNLDGNRVVTSKREDFDLDALMSQYK